MSNDRIESQVRIQQDSQLRVDKRQIPAISGHSPVAGERLLNKKRSFVRILSSLYCGSRVTLTATVWIAAVKRKNRDQNRWMSMRANSIRGQR